MPNVNQFSPHQDSPLSETIHKLLASLVVDPDPPVQLSHPTSQVITQSIIESCAHASEPSRSHQEKGMSVDEGMME